jgi:hypothetical protein
MVGGMGHRFSVDTSRGGTILMTPTEKLLFLILQKDGEEALTELIFWSTNDQPYSPESLRLQSALLKVLSRDND